MSVELLTEGKRCEQAEAIAKVCISSELPWEGQAALSQAGNPVLWLLIVGSSLTTARGKGTDNSGHRCSP